MSDTERARPSLSLVTAAASRRAPTRCADRIVKATALAAGAALLLLAACGQEKHLIGKWSDGSNSTLEFVSGGTCIVLANPPAAITCTWEKTDDGRVIMHETYMTMNVTFVGQMSGDDLVLNGPDGKPMPTLHKIN
jgi:hypothetical protein